jgi:hypothetical protein
MGLFLGGRSGADLEACPVPLRSYLCAVLPVGAMAQSGAAKCRTVMSPFRWAVTPGRSAGRRFYAVGSEAIMVAVTSGSRMRLPSYHSLARPQRRPYGSNGSLAWYMLVWQPRPAAGTYARRGRYQGRIDRPRPGPAYRPTPVRRRGRAADRSMPDPINARSDPYAVQPVSGPISARSDQCLIRPMPGRGNYQAGCLPHDEGDLDRADSSCGVFTLPLPGGAWGEHAA